MSFIKFYVNNVVPLRKTQPVLPLMTCDEYQAFIRQAKLVWEEHARQILVEAAWKEKQLDTLRNNAALVRDAIEKCERDLAMFDEGCKLDNGDAWTGGAA